MEKEKSDQDRGRLDKETGRPRNASIDVDNDNVEVQRLKFDLLIANHELDERKDELNRRKLLFNSKMFALKVVFYPIVAVMLLSAFWSMYMLFIAASPTPSQVETAKFVISTLASAAVATMIGIVATHPAER